MMEVLQPNNMTYSSSHLGREIGIDNDGLDFQQLEQYITQDANL